MNDPYRGPRPVGPPPPPRAPGPRTAPGAPPRPPGPGVPGGDPWAGRPGGARAGMPPGMRVYSWSSGWSSGRPFPWFAILLLVLGAGLLIEILVPDLSFGSLLILAAGLAFGAAWLLGRVRGATMPALVLTAWGVAEVGTELGVLAGEGWTMLLVGIAFLVGWVLGRRQGLRREWSLVLGAVFGIIGLADVLDTFAIDLDVVVLVPLAMIGVGIWLIVRDRLPRGTR